MFPSFRNTFCHPTSYRYFTVKMQLGRKTRDKLAIFSWSRYDCVILDAERLFSIENIKKMTFGIEIPGVPARTGI